jgi:predicted membrane-bound spermidine synthase
MMGATPVEPRGLTFQVEPSWLDEMTLRTLFSFPADMERVEVEPNTLLDPIIMHYYCKAWSKWF